MATQVDDNISSPANSNDGGGLEKESQPHSGKRLANQLSEYKKYKWKRSGMGSLAETIQQMKQFDSAVVSYVLAKQLEESQLHERKSKVIESLLILSAVILVGAYYFGNMCQWDWITSVYFSWITLSTIGYGDYTPMNRCPGNSYGDVQR